MSAELPLGTTISMYSSSVPVFVRMLSNLDHWLDAANAHAAEKSFDPQVLLGMRLAPDMLPFTKQIQIASDTAKHCVARLSGVAAPKFEDNEATITELKHRIAKTLDFVRSVPADLINGSDAKVIEVPMRGASPLIFAGETYLKHWALPNFYFHLTTAYALLRHNGVPLGKLDFLGRD
jgi:hypothetical protein